jgi:YD repeat-containing protein
MKTFFLLTCLSSFAPFFVKADVNMKDASYFKTWIDFEIRKEAHIFQLRRTYNSRSLHPGLFGFGWCSDFEKRLDLSQSERDNDQIILNDCRLTAPIRFKKKKENLYEAPNKETLEFKDNIYLRTTTKNKIQKFNKLGQLTSLIDSTKDRLDLTYDPSGLLQKITFNKDSELNLKFDFSRRHIQSITSGKIPGAHYRYEDQNLIQVTNSWKNSFSYQYDDLHNLTRIQYPDKIQEILTYDKEKDWILRIDTRNQCAEIFKFTRQGKNSNYFSSAEKRCAGKSITKTVYEFRYQDRTDGSKYLQQVKVTQGNKIQRISYQKTQGPLNESQ